MAVLEQIWSCSLRDCSALQCLWLMEVEEFMWVPKYTSSAAVFLSEPGTVTRAQRGGSRHRCHHSGYGGESGEEQ